jgi:hypothetical protein
MWLLPCTLRQIGIAAIKVKGNGKEKETTTAKRANLIRINFNLDENRVTLQAQKIFMLW